MGRMLRFKSYSMHLHRFFFCDGNIAGVLRLLTLFWHHWSSVYFISSTQFPEYYIKLGHDCLFPYPLPFIHHPAIV
jgi:hypothetical protein